MHADRIEPHCTQRSRRRDIELYICTSVHLRTQARQARHVLSTHMRRAASSKAAGTKPTPFTWQLAPQGNAPAVSALVPAVSALSTNPSTAKGFWGGGGKRPSS